MLHIFRRILVIMALLEGLNRHLSPDLSIVGLDGHITCHKLVISTFAPFVKKLLLETNSSTIILPDINITDFEDLLDVCYGVKSESSNELSMQTIFNILGVDSKEILVKNIDSEISSLASGKPKPQKGVKLLRYERKIVVEQPPNFEDIDTAAGQFNKEIESTINAENSNDMNSGTLDLLVDFESTLPIQVREKDNSKCNKVNQNSKCNEVKQVSTEHSYVTTDQKIICKFPCDMCPKVCKREESLTMHKKIKHQQEKATVIVGSRICSFCQLTFKRSDILKHMKKEHPSIRLDFSCKDCNATFPCKAKLEKHMDLHRPRTEKLVCDLCAYESWSKGGLRRHMDRHDTLVQCVHCDYTTSTQYNLERHNERNHGPVEETDFHCDTCNKFLPSKGALKKHRQRHH